MPDARPRPVDSRQSYREFGAILEFFKEMKPGSKMSAVLDAVRYLRQGNLMHLLPNSARCCDELVHVQQLARFQDFENLTVEAVRQLLES